MNDPVNQARRRLTEGGFTCVVLNQGEEFCSHERGVKPLLMLLQSNSSYHGAVAAELLLHHDVAHHIEGQPDPKPAQQQKHRASQRLFQRFQ